MRNLRHPGQIRQPRSKQFRDLLPDLLFWKGHLYSVMEHQKATMLKEIESLAKPTVLENDLDSLAATYAEKYAGIVPVLREAEKEAEHDEVEIDVSQDPRRMAYFIA